MPEIAIKQTLNDQSFRSRLDENGDYMRRWGQNAVREFERVREAANAAAEWNPKKLAWSFPEAHTEQTAWAAAMGDAARTARPGGVRGGIPNFGGSAAAGGGFGEISGQIQSLAGASGIPGLESMLSAAFNPTTLGITAAVAAMAEFGREVVHAAEESKHLADQAERMGMSLGGFEALSVMAKMNSVDVGQLGSTVARLNKNIGEGISDPSSKAATALREVGLSIDSVGSMTPEDAFIAVGEAVGAVQDKFARARMEVALFGKSGQELDLILKKVAKGGLTDAAAIAVSGYDRAVLAEAGEQIEKLSAKWTQFWTGIRARAVESFVGVDAGKIQERLKPPEIAGDKEAERLRQIREEIDKVAESGKSAREKFIDRFHPDTASLAAWDAVNAKVKESRDSGEAAAKAIERMADAIKAMRAEVEGSGAPNKALEGFDKGRKYKDSDVERLQEQLGHQRNVLGIATFDEARAQKALDNFAPSATQDETASRFTYAQDNVGYSSEARRRAARDVAETERQLAEATKERDQRSQLASMPDEQTALRAQLDAQHQGDAAARSWSDRLAAASKDADQIAASLIAGSKQFAGNLDGARSLVKEVRDAERTKAANTAADRFETSMADEFAAKNGETSRQAQLRHLMQNGGLSAERAEALAGNVAHLDAIDEIDRRAARQRAFAPSADQGSREAYNLLHQPQGMTSEEKQAELQQTANQKLDDMLAWLRTIAKSQSQVANEP